jgi:DNA replicative helicase MCM subunit Mcm2 (Cdc46/Mcm family)
MSDINERKPHNYSYLRKYLIHASSIKEVKFTKEARSMLNEFWVEGKLKRALSIRMYNGLDKIAEAHAKLQLKNTVDEDIANQVMEDMRLIMVQYGETVGQILGLREVTYNICLEILRSSDVGMTIEEMCRLAVLEDHQVGSYLGYIWNIADNHRVRQVYDLLLNHPCVKK